MGANEDVGKEVWEAEMVSGSGSVSQREGWGTGFLEGAGRGSE